MGREGKDSWRQLQSSELGCPGERHSALQFAEDCPVHCQQSEVYEILLQAGNMEMQK